MSLRGDLKVGRLKRGDLLLRAKGHFKGGPKTVDETMLGKGFLARILTRYVFLIIQPIKDMAGWGLGGE